MRGATFTPVIAPATADFNPRSSCEERRIRKPQDLLPEIFQSTLLMRGATISSALNRQSVSISIHAPHARSDGIAIFQQGSCPISIHAPHARSDQRNWRRSLTHKFQSTLLMRGATFHGSCVCIFQPDFNPRSSCEERLSDSQALQVAGF